MSDNEILNYLIKEYGSPELVFIGQYYNKKGIIRFINVRTTEYFSLNILGNDELNTNLKGKKLWVQIDKEIPNLKQGIYYQFKAKLAPKTIRLKHQNPFAIQIDDSYFPVEYNPIPKEFITKRYAIAEDTHFANNQQLAKAINSIQREINKSPETFIFELLQNASDYPDIYRNNKFLVSFKISENYLLFCHSGSAFKVNNVHAICSVNESDKTEDIDKIGFKGIGFKSVFKDSSFVYINSGGYSFRFDSSRFVNEKPYQIIPIWTEQDEIAPEVVETIIFKNSPVSIALKPRRKEKLREYERILNNLFADDRILLFLPNIETVKIITPSNYRKSYKNIWKYWIGKERIDIPIDIRDWINDEIEGNESVIPEKYYNIPSSEIQFATTRKIDRIEKTQNSLLYNYLPTKVNLGFDFLINGDFIPDGSREYFHNIKWNHFLIEQAGFLFLKWLKSIGEKRDEVDSRKYKFKRDYVKLIPLISQIEKNIIDERNLHLLFSFKRGFDISLIGDEELRPVAFIPTKSGALETLANILIDETGLADVLDKEFFELTGISAKLISDHAFEGIDKIKSLIIEYNIGAIYGIDELKSDINSKFQDWLKIPLNNYKFIKHIKTTEKLNHLLVSEQIILTENLQLRNALTLLSDIPIEVEFLPIDKVNRELLSLLKVNGISMTFKEYNSLSFFTEYISECVDEINLYLSSESNLLNLWKYIFDNWFEFEQNKNIVDCLKRFEVLCKSETNSDLAKIPISKAYLSLEYNCLSDIESVVKALQINSLFISEKYISKEGDEEKWRKIFRSAGAICDLQKLIADLIPKLPSIQEDRHFMLARQIFKYWRDNRDKSYGLATDQIDLIKSSLKIKCNDGKYRNSSKCFISDHFQTNKIVASILIDLELPNVISAEYSSTQITEWNLFFKEIGCNPLEEKQRVLDAKIDYYVSSQHALEEKHFEIMKSISDLYKLQELNGFSFSNSIFKIKLLTNTSEWHVPASIHLSDNYKPRLNLQEDKSLALPIQFLNEKYRPNEIDKKFLIELGVLANFSITKVERQYLFNLNVIQYKQLIENDPKYIADRDGLLKHWSYGYRIEDRTYVLNHFDLSYYELLSLPNYYDLFIDFISSRINYDFIIEKTYLSIWENRRFEQNTFILFLLNYYENFLASDGSRNKPLKFFSRKLDKYIYDKSQIPQYDLSDIQINDKGLSLEEAIGVQQRLSPGHCIALFSQSADRITIEEIRHLNIVEILSRYQPTEEERNKLFLLNKNYQWKPATELFITRESSFQLSPDLQLHEMFYPLVDNFKVEELSENNLILKTIPELPVITDIVLNDLEQKVKFIAYKIDQVDSKKVAQEITELIRSYTYYEVDSISKVFPEYSPLIEIDLDFYKENNTVYFRGNWKSNKSLIEFMLEIINNEKIELVWFENVLSRWEDDKIIDTLVDMFGRVPPDWIDTGEGVGLIWEEFSEDESNYIRSIITINYDFEGQVDANTTAKIKTLMEIRSDYNAYQIFDEGRYLKAENDEIIVRSAQKGLLYLDLYSWGKLADSNVLLSVYTDNRIHIFKSQDELIAFTMHINRFGVLRIPESDDVSSYNSLSNIVKKEDWKFVFIVNENAKAAKKYKEIIDDLEEYNNYGK